MLGVYKIKDVNLSKVDIFYPFLGKDYKSRFNVMFLWYILILLKS